jgi:type I restriction enzyme S subunit
MRTTSNGARVVRVGDVCELNPRRPTISRPDRAPTTFVPMPAVAERGRGIVAPLIRPFAEVRKGYTYFADGDVLFAKITPCMQNGKHAIASGLIGGIGFGSTEFHVIRPGPEILPEWVLLFLVQPKVLQDATAHFTGAVGQQRVPGDYIASLEILLPPLADQRRVASEIREKFERIDRARVAAAAQLEAAKALPAAYLRESFESPEAQKWPIRSLGEVLRLRKEVVHPRNNPSGPAIFVGLEHIESQTGIRTGSVSLEMSELTGRKPKFYKDDIVYGYLRPYLNKVWRAEFDGLCSVDQYVYEVRNDVAEVDFIAWFMRSATYLNRAPIETTPGQLPRIRTEEVARVPINLPIIDKQRRIAADLNARMEQIRITSSVINDQLATLTAYPASVLSRAFQGNH